MIILYVVEKKHFCRYCLQALSTEEISKRHIKNGLKTNGKQRIIMPKEVNTLDAKIMREI